MRAEWQVAPRRRWSPPAACTSSAPSATSRAASTTSCAAAPAARATPAPRASTCRWRTRCCASSAASALRRHHGEAQDARGRGDRAPDGQPLDREGAAQGRGAQLRHPQAAARVRRRRQRPAQGDLPAAQRTARDRRHLRDHPQHDPRRGRRDRPPLRAGRERRGAVGHARPGDRRSPPSSSCRRPVGEWLDRPNTTSPTTSCASAWSTAADDAVRQARKRRSAPELMRQFERSVMLQSLDYPLARAPRRRWTTCARASTCAAMRRRTRSRNTSARPSSCSRDMLDRIKQRGDPDPADGADAHARRTSRRSRRRPAVSNVQYQHADYDEALGAATADAAAAAERRRSCAPAKVGRNDPCPCGSGKKYKQCHGKLGDARDREGCDRLAMPVRTPCPPTAPADLLPVAGVALGTAAAKIKNWAARRRAARGVRARQPSPPACSRRTASAPRRSPSAAATSAAGSARRRSARWSSTPATPMRAPARAGSPTAETTCAAVAPHARLHAAGSAAVLHRRDHGAAAGGQASSRRCRPRARALAPDHWFARGVGDHDHRHRAQGRVAARASSTA